MLDQEEPFIRGHPHERPISAYGDSKDSLASASTSTSQPSNKDLLGSNKFSWITDGNPTSYREQVGLFFDSKDAEIYDSVNENQQNPSQKGFWDSDEVKKLRFERSPMSGFERMNMNSTHTRASNESFESLRSVLTDGFDSLRRQFDPSFVNISASSISKPLYSTFTCPKCHTTQREFFSVDSVAGNERLVSPIIVAIAYLSCYWLMAIYIYGEMEGWSPLDCIYFSVITLTTAGLGDYVPTTNASKAVTIIFIYVGVAMIGLVLGSLLANSMDDLPREKTRQLNIENCPNCKLLNRSQHTPENTYSFGNRASSLRQKSVLGNSSKNMSPKRNLSKMWFSERAINIGKESETKHDVYMKDPNLLIQNQRSRRINPMTCVNEEDDIESLFPIEEQKALDSNPQKSFHHRRHASAFPESDCFKGFGDPSRDRATSYDNAVAGNTFLQQSAKDYGAVDNNFMNNSSSRSESTTTSITSSRDPFQPIQRNQTIKYILLTLKDAVANSLLVIFMGALGFMMIDGIGMVDSLYFTTVLLTTVGYGDIVPKSSEGKAFATFYVLVGGTVLLNNMSKISMIPLELRKQRMERTVMNQFGLYLDDASLRELASGPLMRRIRQTLGEKDTMLDECSREMFLIAMLVRLGRVTEHDISLICSVFRSLDSGNDGRLDSRDIIFGELRKRSNKATLKEWRRAQRKQRRMKRAVGELANAGTNVTQEYDNYAYLSDDEGSYDSAPEFAEIEASVDLKGDSLKRSVSMSALWAEESR